MSLMKKLKLYDGEDVEGFSQKDVKELQEETVREGMDGISPRYVINRLSSALVREGVTCINPIDALRALRDGLEQHTSITREQPRALPQPDRRGAPRVRRAGQEGSPAGLRLLASRSRARDAAEQLPGQRRGVLQQAEAARPDNNTN